MIGVSPAYLLSRFTDRFTVKDIITAIQDIQSAGFRAMQFEIFHFNALDQWKGETFIELREAYQDSGLTLSVFVAHFLLEVFRSEEVLRSKRGPKEFVSVLEIIEEFPDCNVIAVPQPPFSRKEVYTKSEYRTLWMLLLEKLNALLEQAEKAGIRIALEIMPWSLLGNTDRFLRLCEELPSDKLGYLFDTGHAWACKEDVASIPFKLGNRIFGTHLCDNDGGQSLSLTPGKGTIAWSRLIPALRQSEYTGSFDLEIGCNPDEVYRKYINGKKYITELMEP